MLRKLYSLVFIRNKSQILLGFKKRGFCQGKWNGFGGKVESGEDTVTCAKRELLEESNVTAHSLDKIGILEFEFVGDPVLMEVHVFLTADFSGEPLESEEMRPKWFALDCIPFSDMWADDRHWFPIMLKGKKFQGYFKFQGHETILESKLSEVSDL